MKENRTIQFLLNWGGSQLRKQVFTPQLDAEVILSYVLKTSRAKLFLNPHQNISSSQIKLYRFLILRRKKSEPVAYLTRQKEFYGRTFYVDKRVLIPRPSTELIIGEIKKFIQTHSLKKAKILDIGTGSGCIAATLKCELKNAHIFATDISPAALKVAKKNFRRLGVAVPLYKSDLFRQLPVKFQHSFQIIASNPPYLHNREKVSYATIQPTPLFEPPAALYPQNKNHLYFYNQILTQSHTWLQPHTPTLIILEIPPKSKKNLLKLAGKNFPTSKISILKDLANQERILSISD